MFALLANVSIAQTNAPKRNVDDLSDDEISLFLERAQSSGMTEMQIEKAAKAQGYTPADIAKMRARIANAQTAGNNSANGGDDETADSNDPYDKNNARDDDGSRTTKGKLSNKKKTNLINGKNNLGKNNLLNQGQNPNDVMQNNAYTLYDEFGNEKEIPLTLEERKLLSLPLDIYNDSLVKEYKALQLRLSRNLEKTIFGSSLFNNEKLTFEPDLRIATPKSYQIGPDDELNIHIFGDVLDNFKVKVSPEGTVKILNLGPIYINGLTVDVASERIVSRLRQLYQGLNKPGSGSSAQVTLGSVRSIKVVLTGEVKFPGTYTVSSLATVFNALYVAGGPSENGSYRNIKVIRGNKIVRTLDLYDFLLRADQKDNIHLQDQDIIRIADYENRIEMTGEVKRPMIFESIK